MCVMRDFDPIKAQKTEVGGLQAAMENAVKIDDDGNMNVNTAKIANQVLQQTFTPSSGVTNDTIRRNKITECLKNIFSHRVAYAVPCREAAASHSHEKSL